MCFLIEDKDNTIGISSKKLPTLEGFTVEGGTMFPSKSLPFLSLPHPLEMDFRPFALRFLFLHFSDLPFSAFPFPFFTSILLSKQRNISSEMF